MNDNETNYLYNLTSTVEFGGWRLQHRFCRTSLLVKWVWRVNSDTMRYQAVCWACFAGGGQCACVARVGEQPWRGLGVLARYAAAAVWAVYHRNQRRVEPTVAERRAGVQQQTSLLSTHSHMDTHKVLQYTEIYLSNVILAIGHIIWYRSNMLCLILA